LSAAGVDVYYLNSTPIRLANAKPGPGEGQLVDEMIIPITLASSSQQPLPAGLARLSSTEVVLIELQGALEVEAKVATERNGKLVGTLSIDEKMVSCVPSNLLSPIG
jgi:hypothetical protein